MNSTIICPICGLENVAGTKACSFCNTPLADYVAVLYFPDVLYNRALRAYENGDYANAIELLSASVILKPKEPQTYFLLIDCYLKTQNYQMALEKLMTLKELKSDAGLDQLIDETSKNFDLWVHTRAKLEELLTRPLLADDGSGKVQAMLEQIRANMVKREQTVPDKEPERPAADETAPMEDAVKEEEPIAVLNATKPNRKLAAWIAGCSIFVVLVGAGIFAVSGYHTVLQQLQTQNAALNSKIDQIAGNQTEYEAQFTEWQNSQKETDSKIESDLSGLAASLKESMDVKSYVVAASKLNIRSGPGTSYPVIGVLEKGEIIKGKWVDNWVQFSYDGKTAYCSSEFLK